ncbi:hypothetical protein F4604DRAFT_1987743 [Suillus subluteus]|nr:hypothetical protein F4604DRAFT_1987743 [Suillus subluteus]
MALVNHLPFRRKSQQAHPSSGHLHHPNKVAQFLQRHVPFRRSTSSPGQPQVVNVAAAHGNERVIVVSVPHYKKVNDTRRPTREEPVSHNTAQSDTTSVISYTDSLPNIPSLMPRLRIIVVAHFYGPSRRWFYTRILMYPDVLFIMLHCLLVPEPLSPNPSWWSLRWQRYSFVKSVIGETSGRELIPCGGTRGLGALRKMLEYDIGREALPPVFYED